VTIVQQLADELSRLVAQATTELRTIDEAVATARVSPQAWSIKEIVGHLIDSAANNHHRFVRAQQAEPFVFPGYDQNAWVALQGYRDRPWLELVEFWALYNSHVLHIVRRIPEGALGIMCHIGGNEPVTLRFLVEDYVGHMRHHLRQIGERRPA
jgi:hypothetical protein